MFLVGTTPQTNLKAEADEYNDIYQWDFTEDLFNLTNKGTDNYKASAIKFNLSRIQSERK